MTTKDPIRIVPLFYVPNDSRGSFRACSGAYERIGIGLEEALTDGTPIIIGLVPNCCGVADCGIAEQDKRLFDALNKSKTEMLLINDCSPGFKYGNSGGVFVPDYRMPSNKVEDGPEHLLSLMLAVRDNRKLYEAIRPCIRSDLEKFDSIFQKYF